MAQTRDGLSRELGDLSAILLSEERLGEALHRIAALAARTISSCDGAAVTLSLDGRAVTSAHTDQLTADIDSIQYETDEGPCLDAIRTSETFRSASLSREQRWPQFCNRASKKGISSCLSLPLIVREKTRGALNLYSRAERGFADEDRETGAMIAEQATTALSYAQMYESTLRLSEELYGALDSRAVVDQAKGILMAQESCTQEEAFAMLNDASHGLEERIEDVAQQVIDSLAFRESQR